MSFLGNKRLNAIADTRVNGGKSASLQVKGGAETRMFVCVSPQPGSDPAATATIEVSGDGAVFAPLPGFEELTKPKSSSVAQPGYFRVAAVSANGFGLFRLDTSEFGPAVTP